MSLTESRKRANKKYINANYSTLSVKLPKTCAVFDLLTIATTKTGISKAEYVKRALYAQFAKDGVYIEGIKNNDQTDSELDIANPDCAADQQMDME